MNNLFTSEFLVTVVRWLISLSTGYLVANGTITLSDKSTFTNGIYDIFVILIVLSVAVLEHRVALKKDAFIEDALIFLQGIKEQTAQTATPTTTAPVQSLP